MLFPVSTFAADVPTTFITGIDMTVDAQSASSFEPSNGEEASFDISYDTTTYAAELAAVTGYAQIKKGNDVVLEIMQISSVASELITLEWDGKESDSSYCGEDTVACDVGSYTFEVHIESISGADTLTQTVTEDFEITNTMTGLFDLTYPGDTLDPSQGDNEDLDMDYSLSTVADNIRVRIYDEEDDEVKTISTSSKDVGSFTWNGEDNGDLVDPGDYLVRFTAEKSGYSILTLEETVEVKYEDSDRPAIRNLDVTPSSFDPDYGDLTIEFENDGDANLTVEIRDENGSKEESYNSYDGEFYNDDETHELSWSGKENDGDNVPLGDYYVYIRAENNYGVTVETVDIEVNNSQGSVPSKNSHIENIKFSPSSTFEPEDDEELEIEYDIEEDLDELLIIAQKGGKEIEILDDSSVDKDNNYEAFWDGEDDDGDFAEEGTWKIFFYTTDEDGTNLVAAKSIKLEYTEPEIDDFYLSKKKFDNDLGEFTYVLVRMDEDAIIEIEVLEDNDVEDEIVEDFEVEKDHWYAFEWDGGSFEYDDDMDIRLTAYTLLSEEKVDQKTLTVDLAEDDVSSSRSNVTEDYIDPVIGSSATERVIYFDLEDDAEVTVTIHKGKTTSGSEVAELVDKEDLDSGQYEITWDGRDDDGDKLSSGYYTYEIVSDKSSEDKEYGTFIVGVLGDIDGGGGSYSDDDDDDDDDGKISNAIISINGNIITPGGSNNNNDEDCGGFSDVSKNSQYCQAIEWAEEEGIFQGYSDGKFKPYQTINRVEMLKVVMETLNINVLADDYTSQGFNDVQIGEWYMKYIRTAKLLGIFKGDDGAGTARPGNTVNRAEALKILFETLRISTGYIAQDCTFSYGDVSEIAWFKSYACESKSRGLYSGSSLLPGKLSTRGEIAGLLYDAHQAGLF